MKKSLEKNRSKVSLIKPLLFLFLLLTTNAAISQNNSVKVIKGQVLDANGEVLIGATIFEKDTKNGTITDFDGNFTLKSNNVNLILVVSYVGMSTQELKITDKSYYKVILKSKTDLSDVIIVGYAVQKPESVVGSISQTSGDVLLKAGGVTNIGSALTGNLPGVTTISGSGAPGGEDPMILIRGQGTWNNSNPLILVDGIERSIVGLDINSVETISVLKDASATAVFGVKGANGVILIKTKRGKDGKANINYRSTFTTKVPSRLPENYDSYDALRIRNMAIENEVSLNEGSWADYTPMGELLKYRYPSSVAEAEQYPNINWLNETVKDYAISTQHNLNIAGGNEFVKYYTAFDYLKEGDLLKKIENNKGYSPAYGYDRLNVRCNLDFNLTKTTTLSANLAMLYANKQDIYSGDFEYRVWAAAYGTSPNAMVPVYSDGFYGVASDAVANPNSVEILANSGIRKIKTTQMNTDITLNQDLGILLNGLSLKGTIAMDNKFVSEGGISDYSGNTYQKRINPDGTVVYYTLTNQQNSQYDYIPTPWGVKTDEMRNWATTRKLFYQLQLNYARKFGLNNVTAMGLFSRDEVATGSEFPNYREDWVFRTTYDYDSRYFVEFNGAYNGSEKFSRAYRFDFFPSAAMGWMVSNEKFMSKLNWIDVFKLRASYGKVGNDNVGSRWMYMSQWSYGNQTNMGIGGNEKSPYTWYTESVIGNPDVHWETVTKKNIGLDLTIFNGLINCKVDVFEDYHDDILITGASRAVPDYFGGTPSTGNLGKVKVNGFEFEIKLNHKFSNGLRLWGNVNMTHSKDKVLEADDPIMLDAYLKQQGYQIGQYRSQIITGYANTWDEIYGSTVVNSYDDLKLPGYYEMIDFNGDGIINEKDAVPYGYPERPQNTYNYTAGFEYKGFSGYVQFYGVNNVTRNMSRDALVGSNNIVPKVGEYWSEDNTEAGVAIPRWQKAIYSTGDLWNYDASYLRLKNLEVAYTFDGKGIKKLGIQNLKLFLNGDNLLLFSDMPDDREANFGQMGFRGAYPTVKRFNFGIDITL